MPAACSAAAIESFAWCTLYLCAWLRFLIHLPPPARSAAMRTQRPQRSVPPLVPMADRESCSSSFSISMQSCRNHSFVFFPPPPWMCAAARSAAGPARGESRGDSRWERCRWAVECRPPAASRRRAPRPRLRGLAGRGAAPPGRLASLRAHTTPTAIPAAHAHAPTEPRRPATPSPSAPLIMELM